jgi:hypothetical protein
MKYRVLYTEEVIYEVVFEGPEGLEEEDFFEAMDADENAQTKRLDVTERNVSRFQKEPA